MNFEAFSYFIPTFSERILIPIGGAIGACWAFLFGEISDAFYWLCAFMCIDYATGIWKACLLRNFSSKQGFKGICKKALIVAVVVMCHGLDKMIGTHFIETAGCFAFALNEFASVLENIEEAGYGSVIPDSIRRLLKIAREKEEEQIRKLETTK